MEWNFIDAEILDVDYRQQQRSLLEEEYNDNQQIEYSTVTENNSYNYTASSCNYIYNLTSNAEEQCQFAKTCNNNQGIWAPFVFCWSSSKSFLSQTTLCILLSPIMIVWLIILFRLLK